MDELLQFVTKVAVVKKSIYQNLENSTFCKCNKMYFLRGRTVHKNNCIVGLCVKGWGKMRQLLDRADHVFMMNLFRAKAKLWSVEDHEREDEYKRVQGLQEDADNYVTRFCFLAQDIYYQSQDLLDGGRVQLDEELMTDESFELHISRGIPLHERLATTHCLPWDYFQSIFDIWSRD